jgi:G3E family GTPase
MPSSTAIPTTVFSGFLGSGKTTIISHLVEQLQNQGKQVIYIKNEIGDENVDGQIMQGKHIKTKELLNGCICCTLVGPFIQAIDEVITTFQPDRIIIEASGAADPAAIALMIDSHPKMLRDGVISVIDVVNFEGYKDLSHTAQNQTKFTDLLVFNKVELVDDQRKEAVVGYVRELNNHSPVVEAPHGQLNTAVAFGISSTELESLLAIERSSDTHEHEHHEDHLAEDGITTFHITTGDTYDKAAFAQFLQSLPGSVYRVKGFVQFADGYQLVNKVGTRHTFEAPPEAFVATGSSIVFIGFHILEIRDQITQQLAALAKK